MPYNINVPLANQRLSASQPLLLQNTVAVSTVESADHVPFNDALEGKHAKVSLIPAAVVPAFAGVPGIWSLVSATSPIMLHTAAGIDINISDKVFTAPNYAGATVTITADYFYLPCGLLVKFGTNRTNSAPVAGHLTANIDLNAIGAAYSAVPFVMVSGFQTPMGAAPIGGGGTNIHAVVRYLTAAALNVDTRASSGGAINGSFQWFTIGTV